METIEASADAIAVPAFGLGSVYFASKQRRSKIETGLMIFNIGGFIVSTILSAYHYATRDESSCQYVYDADDDEDSSDDDADADGEDLPIMCRRQLSEKSRYAPPSPRPRRMQTFGSFNQFSNDEFNPGPRLADYRSYHIDEHPPY